MVGTKVKYEVIPEKTDTNLSLEVEYLEEGNFSIAVLVGGIAEPVLYKGILGAPEKVKAPKKLVFERKEVPREILLREK